MDTRAQDARHVALIASGQVERQADDNAANHRTTDRIDAAQDNGWEGQQRNVSQRGIDRKFADR